MMWHCFTGGRRPGPPSKYKEVLQQAIRFPASHFENDVPGMYYVGVVLRKDPSHSGHVVVRFKDEHLEDSYYLPIEVSS